jgi:hypothetical protein
VAWNSKFSRDNTENASVVEIIVQQRNTPTQHTAQRIAATTAITTSEERVAV